MNYAKFDEVKNAAHNYSKIAITGERNILEYENQLLKTWITKNCRERNKNSCYLVKLTNTNLGTKKYSDYRETVDVFDFTNDTIKETDKSYVIKYTHHSAVIKKASVIGWLSK